MSNAGYNIEEAIELSEFSDLLTFICVFDEDADPALHYPLEMHYCSPIVREGRFTMSLAEWLQTYQGELE